MAAHLDEQIIRIIVWILSFIGLYFSIFWTIILFSENQPNSKKKYSVWPSVSIIVPMYNEEDTIEETLDSLFALDYPKDKLKIICVNDGSKDKTIDVCKKLQKKYNFILINQKNQGKYMAMNNALKYVDTEFFACFDADTTTDRDSLKSLIEEFDTKEVAATMPVMKVYKPENILQRVQWLEYILNIFYKYIMGKLDCIHVTPGPFSTYRTKYVKELGGFKKGHLTEDLEMALRLQDKHYKLKQCMDAVVYTKSPKSVKAFVSQRTRWYHGTVLNVVDYKHFLFNKKYGDFGFFHIPLVAIGGLMSILGVSTVVYVFIKQLYHTIKAWYLTNFDFWTYISTWKWNSGLLDFNYEVMYLTCVFFIFIFTMIYLSFIGTKEHVSVLRSFKYLVMFVYYFFLYRFLMAYIWVKVFFKVISQSANSWDKVTGK
jgi:biofilm PGA synthesis N-glycosyltransferase PgaC